MTHPHDNTWCRAVAAMRAYWRRLFGRSPAAETCMALSVVLLAICFTLVMPFLLLWSLEIGIKAMNKPFVKPERPEGFRAKPDNVALLFRHGDSHEDR